MSKDPAENAGSLSDEPKFEDVVIDIAEGEDQAIQVIEDEPKEADKPVKTAEETRADPIQEPRKPVSDYDPVADLRAQLEASNRRAEEERKGRETERQAREEAENYAVRAGREAEQAKGAKIQSDLHSVINAISAETAESESAKRAMIDASSAGDHTAVAEAQQAMARAEARLIALQDGKSQLERMVEQQKARVESEGKRRPASEPAKTKAKAEPTKVEPQKTESTGDPAEDYIRTRTQRTAEFLRKNDRGWLTNPKNFHRLQAAHSMALSEGYTQESDAYFEFINGRMSETASPASKQADPVPQAKKTQVSAPPSRESAVPSSRSSTQVHLNSDQLAMAKSLGMSPLQYAKQVVQLRNNAKAGSGPRFSVDST